MNMMAGNTLLSVTTRSENTISANDIIGSDGERSFYRVAGGTERFRILLVGKEQRERQTMYSTLSHHVHFAAAYLEAASGEIALRMVANEAVDLIVLWDSIADMGSLEFLGRLNRKCGLSNAPVIAILNRGATKTGLQAMKMGVYAFLLKDAEGINLESLPILASRIHAEQQTLSALRQTTSMYQTITDCIPAVIYRFSLQGGLHDMRISPQMLSLGFFADKWRDEADPHLRMCHKEDLPGVRKALEHSCQTGTQFQCEYRINTTGHTPRWFHDKAVVIRDEFGRPQFLQGVMTDITGIKSLENELAHFRGMLERKVRERTERLERRLAILESCTSCMGDNYHKMHRMYLDLLIKRQVSKAGAKSLEFVCR